MADEEKRITEEEAEKMYEGFERALEEWMKKGGDTLGIEAVMKCVALVGLLGQSKMLPLIFSLLKAAIPDLSKVPKDVDKAYTAASMVALAWMRYRFPAEVKHLEKEARENFQRIHPKPTDTEGVMGGEDEASNEPPIVQIWRM